MNYLKTYHRGGPAIVVYFYLTFKIERLKCWVSVRTQTAVTDRLEHLGRFCFAKGGDSIKKRRESAENQRFRFDEYQKRQGFFEK